jgi:membrane protease YdiL (CAAX protease family)
MSDASPPPDQSQPPEVSPLPTGRSILQSPSLLFVFLRIAIYIVLSTGIAFAVQWILAGFADGSLYSPRNLVISEISPFVGAFAAAAAMAQVEGRRFGDYGLPLRGAFGKLFWQGAAFGLAEISAVVGAISIAGSYHFGSLAIHGADIVRWTAFWGMFFLLVGLYEEFAFRGYVQFTLAQAVRFWPAAILLSVAFGVVHRSNPGESKLGLAGVVLTGLFWCFTLRRTGNLWFAVGMHASFDFAETFLYSVPDSGVVFPGHLSNATLAGATWLTGGSAGPEASVCDFIMLLVFFYAFDRLYPSRPQSLVSQTTE